MSEGAALLDWDGRFLYASPSAARLFQTPAAALIGRFLTSLVEPDDQIRIAARLADVARNEQGFAAITFRVHTPSDACVWIEAKLRHDPDADAIVATCLDVTGLRERESRVSPSPGTIVDKLWLAIEQTADSVVITDREGVIEYVNPAFEEMSGYTRDEAIGRTPRILRSGLQAQRFYETLWNTILAGRTFRSTMTNRRRDGTLYDEDQTITPIRDGSGMVTHFVSTGRDITQRNRTQEALRRMNHRFESEATRIASTLHDEAGQFLAAVHITLADVARDVDPAVRERLNEARKHLDLVEARLREVSHEIHPRVVEDLGLRDAVTFLADSFARRTGVKVNVASTLEGRSPLPVETLLYRFVQEGLTNVGRHARATRAVVTLDSNEKTITCSIQDDGIGFDPAALQGRTECGLGLRVMQDRLDAVGGSLTVVSVPGQRTELRACVPVED